MDLDDEAECDRLPLPDDEADIENDRDDDWDDDWDDDTLLLADAERDAE